MHIGRVVVQLHLIVSGETVVVRRGTVPSHHSGPDSSGLIQGQLAPGTGHDVVRRGTAEQVPGDHRKLQAGTPLQKQHLVIVRQIQQGSQMGFGPRQDLAEHLAAMADLQHRHAQAGQCQHLVPDMPQNRFGQHGRTGRKVVDAACQGSGHEVGL